MKRWPLAATFVLFIVLSISAAYWAMHLFKPPLRPVAAPPHAGPHAVRLDAAADLFGRRPATAVVNNFQLRGVVVASDMAESVAILAVGGRSAQAIRVNAEVASGVKLSEVHPDYVLLSEKGSVRRVDLPEDARRQARVGAPGVSSGNKKRAVRSGP